MPLKRKIMIVAGEPSGDTHAAKLVNAIRSERPEIEFEFFGAAGPRMRASGVDAVVESDRLSVVGLEGIALALPMFIRTYRALKNAAAEKRPDGVVFVDFPDFNLKMAKSLKKAGLRTVYYISPQLWAWRKYRIGAVKRSVDLMLTILPFERDWYIKNGFDRVKYVGSPLAREVHPDLTKAEFCQRHGLDRERTLVALLPGSRDKEISKIFPLMRAAVRLISTAKPDAQFVTALNSAAHLKYAHDVRNMVTVVDETYDALNAADAAAITSGTATLEAGIIGTPMAIVYATSSLNYRLFSPMIDVPHYGLINLIAGKRVAKELIQDEFTSASLAAELLRLLDPAVNRAVREELKLAADSLGHGGASKRAAEAILELIDS